MRIKTALLIVGLFGLTSAAHAGGTGTAAVLPTSAPEGGVMVATLTYTIPLSGFSAGGAVRITLPPNWGPILQNNFPNQPGYVTALATGTYNISTSTSTPSITVNAVNALAGGAPILFVFHTVYVNCPSAAGQNAVWQVESSTDPSDPIASIPFPPQESYATGSAQWLTYTPWNPLIVAAGVPSTAVTLQVADSCSHVVNLVSSMSVTIQGVQNNGNTDPGALFATSVTSGALVSPTNALPLLIPAGSSTTAFYYQTTSTGTNLYMTAIYASPSNGFQQSAWRQVNSLASLPTFSGISIDNGTPGAAQTTVTLSPDGDGVNDNAYIRFTASDPTLGWHVLISTNSNFTTNVFEQFGSGNTQNTLIWSGHNQFLPNYPVVPNGMYFVKIEFPGLQGDTSLSATVNTAAITGSVTLGTATVSGAQINAQRTNGPGYSSAISDVNGNYVLNGLVNGAVYNLYAQATSAVSQSVVTGQLTNKTAPSVQNFALQSPAVLRVAATSSFASVQNAYGNINLHTTDYALNFGGNVQIASGSITSTNGDAFTPSTWTVIYAKPGTYVLHINLPGYGLVGSDPTLTLSAGSNPDQTLILVPKANLFGQVILPSVVQTAAMWVPINGVLQGSTLPTIYGGVNIPVGASSAPYTLYSVDPGNYVLRAQPPGYIPASINVTVASSDISNLNISGFGLGGTLTGSLTISGDTSQMTSMPPLYVGVFSPALGFTANTQVFVATSTTVSSTTFQISGLPDGSYTLQPPYLSGFQTSPQNLPKVTVAGGVGTIPAITLIANTGKLTGTITLPAGAVDYGNVEIQLQGPSGADILATGSSYEIDNLGSGYFQLTATYSTSGAQLQTSSVITNGVTQNINLNLSAPTFAIQGNVNVQSGFTMKNSSGSVVTIATLADLLANATNQTLTLGGQANFDGNGNLACQGGTVVSASTARVEAFPKTFNSSQNTNRAGLSNCYGVGQYQYGVIDSSGNYRIPNLSAGLWEIDVYPYFDGGQTPNVATVQQLVTIVASTVTGVNFSLANGNAVSGTVFLPTGVTDTRTFTAQILDSLGNLIQKATIQIGSSAGDANSTPYKFLNLPAGNYSLSILDPGTFDATLNQNITKYVSKPVQFTVAGNDLTGQDITLTRSGRIIGRLAIQGANPDGSPALTLITPANENLLPTNFFISADNDSNNSGSGRSANFSATGAGLAIDANNNFTIDGLVAGTYDISFQSSNGGVSLTGINIANYTQGSVVVTNGQTTDLGTIALTPGLSVTGTVKDQSNHGLGNVRIQSRAANSQNGGNDNEVFTDASGNFTIIGLNPAIKIYNITAAPRPSPGDNTLPVPYGTVALLAIDVTKVPQIPLNFILPPATASILGTVVTVDSGPLSYADPDHAGFPAATIYLHQQGNTLEDNPLGQDSATGLDGSFNIGNLPAGTYDLTVESLGYKPLKRTNVVVTDGTALNLGTLTLLNGPSLTVTLARPDGTLVNTSDVKFAVAASPDLSNILFGQINSDANTGNILSIKFAGFDLTPQTYSVMLFDNNSNITAPPEGQNISFAADSDALVRALSYVPSAPTALTHVLKSGSSVLVTYYFTRPVRNRPIDQDPSQWLTVTVGAGTLSNFTLSGDRRQLSLLYNPAPGEQNATLDLATNTVDIDPATGVEYPLTKRITLLLGQKATAEGLVSGTLGGTISLSDNNDPANISVPGNALLTSSGTAVNTTTSFNVTFTATDDPTHLPSVVGGRMPALQALMARGPSAYVSEAYLAMTKGHASNINPLSSFYSVLLPQGISHSLNQTALLTLSYDSSVDPTTINVYYFDGVQYVLQPNQRTIDPVNHTITVSVNHFSTFVVLQNGAPVVTVGGGAISGGQIEVFNFPNPFDLQPKTKTLAHGGATSTLSTVGTIIRYSIPAGITGDAKIVIYDAVGERVRTIDLDTPTNGVENYIAWDGKNDSGNNVASGVYIGLLKVGGEKRFWKMAVIK